MAPTTMFSLSDTPVDAMAISFYKMFGYPTGVGALIVKKSFLQLMRRPWFSGGNVDIVQVPGTIFTRAPALHEQFEVNVPATLFHFLVDPKAEIGWDHKFPDTPCSY
jgi:molybdenum cofactor sulfurtransferase